MAVPRGKSDERARFLARRKTLSDAMITSARAAICSRLLDHVAELDVACVAAYEPLRTEPGSAQLLAALHTSGIRVLVPVTRADRDLDWAVWSPDQRLGSPLSPDVAAAWASTL